MIISIEKRKRALKEKMLRESTKRKEEREKQKKVTLYSKNRKPPLYEFNETFNTKALFWFRKFLIKDYHWAELPPSAKSVFPVIASYCNKKGKAWPSDITIGILCGRSACSVKKGTLSMAELCSDHFEMKKTKKGKKIYFLNLPSENIYNETFPFFQYVLESGAWRQLKPTAQALYPVMRCLAYFLKDLYKHLEGLEGLEDDEKITFAKRKYEFLKTSDYTKKQLAEYAGISQNSMSEALQELERNWLIESVDGGWKIYLKTKDMEYYTRKYLNECVKKSYKYMIKKNETEYKKVCSVS